MNRFTHIRHQEPLLPKQPRELFIALSPLRSNVNLSRIARAASCFGVKKIITTGHAKLNQKIARDGAYEIELEPRRSLAPALKAYQQQGYRLIALEQTTSSVSLYQYQFPYKSILIAGNEREGLSDDLLNIVDDAVEIPIYGLPYSHNVASATIMAMYEYGRQFP